jgi:signal transduction histidine kinase
VRWFRSLRGRFIVGSLLWGVGLVLLVHVISVLVVVGTLPFRGVIHIGLLLLIAAVLMGGGIVFAGSALSMLARLRERVGAVHEGREPRVSGTFPTEVQPLVSDLNALLDHRDARVQAAVAKAGDLAHGLKTPLAVMTHDADRVAAAGQHELSASLGQQIDRMRRQIDYHLAHARAAASGATPGARAEVRPSAEGLARTLERLHADRGLRIAVDVPDTHAVRGHREDLEEMMGNLLDNACKWARSRVEVSSTNGTHGVTIAVEDDGPGLDAALRQAVLQRGVRADEAAPGSGFGLAIVRELAEVYGGSIALEESALGGLRARLRLPSANEERRTKD